MQTWSKQQPEPHLFGRPLSLKCNYPFRTITTNNLLRTATKLWTFLKLNTKVPNKPLKRILSKLEKYFGSRFWLSSRKGIPEKLNVWPKEKGVVLVPFIKRYISTIGRDFWYLTFSSFVRYFYLDCGRFCGRHICGTGMCYKRISLKVSVRTERKREMLEVCL